MDNIFFSLFLQAARLALAHGLKTTAQVGVAAPLILQKVFTERFQLLTIDA